MIRPICPSKNKCFAHDPDVVHGKEINRCKLLRSTYPDGHCPFQKEEASVTNGKYYPFDESYGERMREREQQNEGEESGT